MVICVSRIDGVHRLAGDAALVEVGNRWLGHLEARQFSPATVRGYAFDGVEVHVREPDVAQGPVAERGDPFVEAGTDPRHLRARDPRSPAHRHHEVIDGTGRDPRDVRLHDHRVQSLIDPTARLEHRREEAALAELGDPDGEVIPSCRRDGDGRSRRAADRRRALISTTGSRPVTTSGHGRSASWRRAVLVRGSNIDVESGLLLRLPNSGLLERLPELGLPSGQIEPAARRGDVLQIRRV